MEIFDRNLLKCNKARNFGSFYNSAFLYESAFDSIATRLFLKNNYENNLLIGLRNVKELELITKNIALHHKVFADSNIDFLKEMDGNKVLLDEERLPFADNSFDLVISALNIHTINDVEGFLAKVLRILKPGGLFIGCLFGSKTLHELKETFVFTELQLDIAVTPHVFPLTDVKEIANLAARCGFVEPVSDTEILTIHYSHLAKLFNDLKNMGERNALYSRSRSFLPKGFFDLLEENYLNKFSVIDNEEAFFQATFEIIYLTAFKK